MAFQLQNMCHCNNHGFPVLALCMTADIKANI